MINNHRLVRALTLLIPSIGLVCTKHTRCGWSTEKMSASLVSQLFYDAKYARQIIGECELLTYLSEERLLKTEDSPFL